MGRHFLCCTGHTALGLGNQYSPQEDFEFLEDAHYDYSPTAAHSVPGRKWAANKIFPFSCRDSTCAGGAQDILSNLASNTCCRPKRSLPFFLSSCRLRFWARSTPHRNASSPAFTKPGKPSIVRSDRNIMNLEQGSVL